MQQVEFGWLEEPLEAEDGNVRLTPLSSHEAAVAWAHARLRVDEKYVQHPQPDATRVLRFELPCTHLLTYPGGSSCRATDELAVAAAGFAMGRKFTLDGVGHLHPTPRKREFVQFIVSPKDLCEVVRKAAAVRDNHGPDACRKIFAAIHWYLTAHCYAHPYDRFAWLYTTIDALHCAAGAIQTRGWKKGRPHGQRIKWLSDSFGSPLADGFGSSTNPARAIVDARNLLIHEALFCDEPVGYAYTEKQHEITHALSFFCSQIVLGLLSVECEFRRASWDFQMHALDVI